jgi:hypothetical protein
MEMNISISCELNLTLVRTVSVTGCANILVFQTQNWLTNIHLEPYKFK